MIIMSMGLKLPTKIHVGNRTKSYQNDALQFRKEWTVTDLVMHQTKTTFDGEVSEKEYLHIGAYFAETKNMLKTFQKMESIDGLIEKSVLLTRDGGDIFLEIDESSYVFPEGDIPKGYGMIFEYVDGVALQIDLLLDPEVVDIEEIKKCFP